MTRLALAFLFALPVIAQQPTFRAATEMVRIDTLVERDGKPVTNLTADDFTVLDNGAPQRIVTIKQMEAVAVGVALDTSGSMEGDRFARAQAATLALLGQLRPDESSVVIGFADLTARLIPAGTPPADRERLLDSVVSAGSTALADGAYAAVIACDTGPGSKLLVVLTDGRNNSGWLGGRDVIDAARRHEVVIYPVGVGVDAGGMKFTPRPVLDPRLQSGTETRAYNEAAAARVAVAGGDALKFLEVVARQTGGRAIRADWTDDLSVTFRAILQEFRQRYIIAFAPEGVGTGDGWHTLEVRLRKSVKGEVHSRAGYWSSPKPGATGETGR
jgi:VWFA-related protein